MPEYLHPGVYVEEIPRGPAPIEGVSTSTAGMAGPTERGPLLPRLVTSWLEYQHWFGGPIDGAFLPLAVHGFFANGGQRLFVARVAGAGSTTATITLPTGGDPLILHANGPGSWGNALRARVGPGSETGFRLTIQLAPDVIEDYDNLTVDPVAPGNLVSVVNQNSRLVTIAMGPVAQPLNVDVSAVGGLSATVQYSDFLGDSSRPVEERTGLAALDGIEDISILGAPDEVSDASGAITNALIDQCERLKNRFAIASATRHTGRVDAIVPPHDSSYAAFYVPWLRAINSAHKQSVLVPPAGHVAGIYARTDLEGGVHKAPANQLVRGLDSSDPLEIFISKSEQDVLNPRGVNVIRDFRQEGRGVLVWGARTMTSNAEWKYVNVRRLFIFLEQSIERGTQWAVFEPNNETTWAKVRRIVTDFLRRVWLTGAFVGATENDAFFVKCDRTTMTQDDIDNGRLICLIGVAPLRPAEFVIFRILQFR